MAKKKPGVKPVHLKAVPDKSVGRQAIWEAMRELKRFTVAQVEAKSKEEQSTIRSYLQGLVKADFLKKVDAVQTGYYKTSFQSAVYEVVKDNGTESPRVDRKGNILESGSGREQMWRTIKIIKEFDYEELAVSASTEEHEVAPASASEYVKFLHRAGYVRCISKARQGNKPGNGKKARYRFIESRNTGPLPPIVQKVNQVFDPNTKQVVWAQNADPIEEAKA